METEKTRNFIDKIRQAKIQTASDFSTEKINLLNQINIEHKNCNKCSLSKQGRKQVVFGQGNPNAKLMFIGEGPGRDEDIKGIPFIGRAGKLLTKIIEAMKFKRKDLYISNVVKCRPPNNRAPLPQESTTCKKSILFKEIEIIKPQIICCLGASASKAILGDHIKISKSRGKFFNFSVSSKFNIKVMPTFHPAYLLRNPSAKRFVWDDMKKIISYLKNTNNP